MQLSIVTVNYRAWQHIRNAFDALNDGFPDNWEIIIVDNESDTEKLRHHQQTYPWAQIIENPHNSGFGVGCNIGVAQASGELLLFMNPDAVATVENIQSLIAVKEANPSAALLSPKQVGTDGKLQKVFDEFPALYNQSKILKAFVRLLLPGRKPNPRKPHDKLTYCDWVTGSFLLISRKDFDQIGGWSSDYWMYVEDADLCKRAYDAGLLTAYAPGVQIVHEHGGSSRINVDVKSMTKLEVIISKHVYVQNHFTGLKRAMTHLFIALLRLPTLLLASLLDLVTFRQVKALSVRRRMFTGLCKHYLKVLQTGVWISSRAQRNQVVQS